MKVTEGKEDSGTWGLAAQVTKTGHRKHSRHGTPLFSKEILTLEVFYVNRHNALTLYSSYQREY